MKYKTLIADPPWKYDNKRTGGTLKSGSSQHYQTLSLDEICSLPIKDIMDRDSICFLWVTVPLIHQCGFQTLEAWGYQYKTMLIWHKKNLEMGFWFRGGIEVCLLGVKGKVKPFHYQKANFIESNITKHSKKPEEFYDLIKPIILNPSIELFATKKREWDCVGFEIDGKDIKETLTNIIISNKE